MLHPKQGRQTLPFPGASPRQAESAQRAMRSLLSLPRFAHHPACGFWSNHLIRVRSVPLCLGCTCMSLGIVAGMALVYPFVSASLSAPLLFLCGVLCYLPTTIQIYVQRYWFKIVARFVLGVGVVLSLGAALLGHAWTWQGMAWSVAILSIFVALLVGTLRWRARNLDVPCDRCQLGRFPFCAWRVPALQATIAQHDRGDCELPDAFLGFVRVVTDELTSEMGLETRRVRFVNVRGCDDGGSGSARAVPP